MNLIMNLFEWYLKTNIHVSISVWSLYKITFFYINSYQNHYLDWVVFTSSFVGYNMLKYSPILFKDKCKILKSLEIVIFFAFVVGVFCFFKLDLLTQIIFSICFIIVFFYSTTSIFSVFSLRSLKGLKIFIISFVWTSVTYLSLLSQMDFKYEFTYIILGIQRFIFVFVLSIPFDIRDVNIDPPELKTIPQTLGILKSKLLGILLLSISVLMFYFVTEIRPSYIIIETIIYIFLICLLIMCNNKKHLNFTRFWVEGLPIIWLVVLIIFARC